MARGRLRRQFDHVKAGWADYYCCRFTLLVREADPLRASHPTLIIASKAVAQHRDEMAARWVEWLGDRITSTRTASARLADAEFRMLLDVFASLVGPLRREVRPLWAKATERYGRHAAARGLAAGEVVEEMQYLRELLIRYLAPAIAALRPRQGMALLLRLNRLVDKGVAMAVVGYTDALVNTLIPGADGDAPDRLPDAGELEAWLEGIRHELEQIVVADTRNLA